MKILKNLRDKRETFEINYNEMNDIIKNNDNVIILDVRSPQEYEEGHINGAINLPLYELCQNIKYKIKNENDIIIAYCSSGIRSKRAVKELKKCGYKNSYSLKDGL
jgi:rhodanese-related sulfurtransferase